MFAAKIMKLERNLKVWERYTSRATRTYEQNYISQSWYAQASNFVSKKLAIYGTNGTPKSQLNSFTQQIQVLKAFLEPVTQPTTYIYEYFLKIQIETNNFFRS